MRERALRLWAQEQEPGPECSKPMEQAEALWGTMVRAVQERNSAKPWMTRKAEVP